LDDGELLLLVFPRDAVTGDHPGITGLPQGFASIVISEETRDCVGRRSVADYYDLDTGQGSYFITSILSCLGLAVRPGASLALLRVSDLGQAGIVFHQAADGRPVPPDAHNTVVVAGWPGAAWTEPVAVLDAEETAPPAKTPINTTLRAIGVARGDSVDEAAALGFDLRKP
jgi:hypothetical protein